MAHDKKYTKYLDTGKEIVLQINKDRTAGITLRRDGRTVFSIGVKASRYDENIQSVFYNESAKFALNFERRTVTMSQIVAEQTVQKLQT